MLFRIVYFFRCWYTCLLTVVCISLPFSPSVTGTTGKTPPDVPVLDKVNFSYQSVKLRWSFPRPQTEASELRYELQMRSLENRYVI